MASIRTSIQEFFLPHPVLQMLELTLHKVFGVLRVDFPPTMVDMKQEGGRAGRCPEGLIVKDFY